ncbi:hypothetical protein [Acidovorax sp. SUPP3334]|uniref:hypothetical protein n=1 Tax=Acidovorax sp. SUPP3334 TaxID=2920881 RepID=UPI0023DE54D7|nr:hypothetical protein [Acidovorax sp. SUPP3334]GKT22513.1 hypothetical protein AVHM3334_08670 [Acidovorax sp. SUPP3334]
MTTFQNNDIVRITSEGASGSEYTVVGQVGNQVICQPGAGHAEHIAADKLELVPPPRSKLIVPSRP